MLIWSLWSVPLADVRSIAILRNPQKGTFMRTMIAAALCALVVSANANAAIKEEPVAYQDGEAKMKGVIV
jgi:hypothetical protein